MTPRRAVGILLASLAAVALIAGMVRYTQQVESRAGERARGQPRRAAEGARRGARVHRPGSGRPAGVDRGAARQGRHRQLLGDLVPALPRGDPRPDRAAEQVQGSRCRSSASRRTPEALEDMRAFAAEYGMNYPIVISTPEIEKIFPGVSALPTTFVLDRDGRLAQKHVGMLIATRTELETLALSGDSARASRSSTPKTRTRRARRKPRRASRTPRRPTRFPASTWPRSRPRRAPRCSSSSTPSTARCGCGLTLAQCRIDDPTCTVSLPIAQALVKKVASQMTSGIGSHGSRSSATVSTAPPSAITIAAANRITGRRTRRGRFPTSTEEVQAIVAAARNPCATRRGRS